MSAIHVFTPEGVIADIDAGKTDVIQIREKKNKPKKNYKVSYLDIFIKAEGHTGPAIFKANDVEITYGLRDPAYEENDDEEGPRKLSVCTSVADSGKFGEMMEKLNPLFVAEVERCAKEKIIVKAKRNVKEFVSTHYSSDRTDEKAGEEFDSPLINFKIDFSLFPDNYPRKFLRGKPKSMVYDFTNDYKDANGRTQYKLAKTPDGDALDDSNAFMFLTSGSVIKEGRIHMESLAVSQNWISVPTLAGKLVVDPAGDGGFDDDAAEGDGFSGEEDDAEDAGDDADDAADEAAEDEDDDDAAEDDEAVDDFLDEV